MIKSNAIDRINHQRSLGVVSYLAFIIWVLLLITLVPPDRIYLVTAMVLAVAGLTSWVTGVNALRFFRKLRFWIFLLSIVALAPFVLGEADTSFGPLNLSRAGFVTGCWMALRAVTLMVAFSATLGSLTVSQTIAGFDRLGMRGMGFALGVALNMLHTLQDVVDAAYHTIRLRGGLKRPLYSFRLFLVTVVANSLRYGDDIVRSAAARAFDPAMPAARPAQPLISSPMELVFLFLLLISAGFLLYLV